MRVRLHAYGRIGHHDSRPGVRASGVPLRADVLELGNGHDLCLESLSEGWQNAIWELGAVPAEHRTDGVSSAVNNTSNLEEFNRRYEAVMKYYGVKPVHTNPASPTKTEWRAEPSPVQESGGSSLDAAGQPGTSPRSPSTLDFLRTCSRSGMRGAGSD